MFSHMYNKDPIISEEMLSIAAKPGESFLAVPSLLEKKDLTNSLILVIIVENLD